MHLWDEVKIALSNADRPDLVKLTDAKDAEVFRKHLHLINKNDLPEKSTEGM